MTVSAQAVRPDVTEMVVIHDVFRDTLGAGPVLVAATNPRDADRVATLITFYDNLMSMLEVHHRGEEERVFPRLIERCPDDVAGIESTAAQHRDVEGAMVAVRRSLREWESGELAAQPRLATAIATLDTVLRAHLADEERDMLPLCEAHLSVAEWGELPGHAMRAFAGDKVWLILGLIRQRMTPEQRHRMTANMPPPAVQMWNTMGEVAFNDLIAAVGAPLG